MLGYFFGMAQKHAQEEQPELVASALGALGGLTRLEELDMRRNVFSGAAATVLAGTLTRLTQLKELTIGQPWGDGQSFTSPEAVAALTAPLGALTSLTKLCTYEGPCSPATIEKDIAIARQRLWGSGRSRTGTGLAVSHWAGRGSSQSGPE